MQGSKRENGKTPKPELGRTFSFERTFEESVANELMLQMQSSTFASSKMEYVENVKQKDESSNTKSKTAKTGRSSQEENKLGKSNDEKRFGQRVMREIHNIKISQVGHLFEN